MRRFILGVALVAACGGGGGGGETGGAGVECDPACEGSQICFSGSCVGSDEDGSGDGGASGDALPPVGGGGGTAAGGAVDAGSAGGIADVGGAAGGSGDAGGQPIDGDAGSLEADARGLLPDAAIKPDSAPLGDTGPPSECPDADGDGFGVGPLCADPDCDDENPGRSPGRDEIPYDGIDQDCDQVDQTDLDDDGFSGEAAGGDDCDDTDPEIHPGAADAVGDGIDQDCNGGDVADGDGDGHNTPAAGGDDCNDSDRLAYPGAEEIPYDGRDQDCDGEDADDLDGDGYRSVVAPGGDDCDDLDPNVSPGMPDILYNDIDDDCDPDTSDDDGDGDGFPGGILGAVDCNDVDPEIYPGRDEVPYNGRDDDCNPNTRDDDIDVDGSPLAADCDDNDPRRAPDRLEVPMDGVDNDCDNQVDEAPGTPCARAADMVALEMGGCIDRFEASRLDATDRDAGDDEAGAPRSVSGVLPWTGLTQAEAATACGLAGKQLCDPEVWAAACAPGNLRFPYGDVYDGAACNGADAGRGRLATTGAFDRCLGVVGTSDMIGNAAEWTSGVNLQTGSAQFRGGDYGASSFDLECGIAAFAPSDTRSPTLGFRCCLP